MKYILAALIAILSSQRIYYNPRWLGIFDDGVLCNVENFQINETRSDNFGL